MKVSWWDRNVKVIKEFGCDLWIIVRNCCANQMNLFLEKNAVKLVTIAMTDLVMIGLVFHLSKFMVYCGFSPGFIFSYLSTGQQIGWKELLRYDLYCVEWDVKPQLSQSMMLIHVCQILPPTHFEANRVKEFPLHEHHWYLWCRFLICRLSFLSSDQQHQDTRYFKTLTPTRKVTDWLHIYNSGLSEAICPYIGIASYGALRCMAPPRFITICFFSHSTL